MAAILQSEGQKWNLLLTTVLGIESPCRCQFVNGELIFSGQPICKGSPQDLSIFSEIIRSDLHLTTYFREKIADLFDPNAESDFKIEKLSRRDGKNPLDSISHDWDAAAYAEARMERGDQADDPSARDSRGDTRDMAVRAAARKYGIATGRVEAAIKSLREAILVHDEIIEQELAPPDERPDVKFILPQQS